VQFGRRARRLRFADGDKIGVSAAVDERPENAAPEREPGSPTAHSDDDTGEFQAERRWKDEGAHRLQQAVSQLPIETVDARCHHVHEDVRLAERRDRDVVEPHDVGPTICV